MWFDAIQRRSKPVEANETEDDFYAARHTATVTRSQMEIR